MSHSELSFNKIYIEGIKKNLLTAMIPELKEVCYMGMAYGIVNMLKYHKLLGEIKEDDAGRSRDIASLQTTVINKIDLLGEEVIIDKPLLLNMVMNMIKAMTNRILPETKPNNFLEFIGLDKYLTQEVISNIDKNFDRFYNMYVNTLCAFKYNDL